jgi:hypothetical protein
MKAHEIISLIRTPLQRLNDSNINTSSVEFLDMYYEYAGMKDEGLKKTYIVASLCEKHNISRATFFRMINSFEAEI